MRTYGSRRNHLCLIQHSIYSMAFLENTYNQLSYDFLTQQSTTGSFAFGFGQTGHAPFVFFYGNSGKLYDQEDNYFHSYNDQEAFSISGSVFSDRHSYFYNGKLIHDSCIRTGIGSGINQFFASNVYLGYGLKVDTLI